MVMKKKSPARAFIEKLKGKEKPEHISKLEKLLEENPNLTERDLKSILFLMKKGKGEWILESTKPTTWLKQKRPLLTGG